jgi:vacuolar-type H+-ATPase subunit F/Vma7
MSEREIAVVGDMDTVLGLGAMGLKSFVLETADRADEVGRTLLDGGYTVILITEKAGGLLGERFAELERKSVVIPITSCRTRQPLGLDALESLIERAIGIAGLMDKT